MVDNVKNIKKRLKIIKESEGVRGIIRRMFPPVWISNSNLRIIQRNLVTQHGVIKESRDILRKIDNEMEFSEVNNTNIIWFCWMQGIASAPTLVKICFDRLKKIYPDKKIYVIDESNFDDYVKFPSFILHKFENGEISTTHFSDLLRLELLIRYGGTWIDSTVLCGERAEEEVYFKQPLFYFSGFLRNDEATAGSSWYLTSASNNPVLLLTRKLIYRYWEKHKKISNYFIFHICFSISLDYYPRIKANVPLVSNVPPHVLVENLNLRFSDQKFDFLVKQSPFHKLSSKVEIVSGLKYKTFFDHLKGN